MKSSAPNLTPLSYTLLGLLKAVPLSGYAIRQVIERTRPGSYSASPGSIYPALRTLLKQGLVVKKRAKGLRHQYHMTPAGEAILWQWLVAPVSEDELSEAQSGAMLRLSVIEMTGDKALILHFLSSLTQKAQDYARVIAQKMDELDASDPLLRLKLQHERLMAETGAMWAAHARKTLESLDAIAAD